VVVAFERKSNTGRPRSVCAGTKPTRDFATWRDLQYPPTDDPYSSSLLGIAEAKARLYLVWLKDSGHDKENSGPLIALSERRSAI
jgi:hypothetical protein